MNNERTLEEKLEGISFLESLGLTEDTIEAIEDGIDHPENLISVDDWRDLLIGKHNNLQLTEEL